MKGENYREISNSTKKYHFIHFYLLSTGLSVSGFLMLGLVKINIFK